MTDSPAPRTNLAGLRAHWRLDAIAALSVALVALPLALGIASAAGAPPISGLVSAIVAGFLTTFVRGSHVAINGPGNALIVIVASAFGTFGDAPDAFPSLLGAVIVAGGLQIALGLLKLGKIGDIIPAAVVQGMLAAIGLIIVVKQAHVLVGAHPPHGTPIDALRALPDSALALNPAATLIGLASLGIVIAHPRIKARFVHAIPAPLWVVLLAIPLAYGLEHFGASIRAPSHLSFSLDPHMLVAIPDDLFGSLVTPSFARIGEPGFWLVVITFTLVCSIEDIVSVKAVDKLDSYRRRSDLDRDLIGVGISTIISALLGGLPVLTVVARSSVNVNHGARTGWSNFFASSLLFVFVVFLGPLIQEIALSALAGILVYTGFKLTAPHVIEDVLRKGPDHFLVFLVTVVSTLVWGVLSGIALGLAAEVLSHLLILGQRPGELLRRFRESTVETRTDEDGPTVVRVDGIATFLSVPRVRRALEALPSGQRVIVDFNHALLVDNTMLEHCHEFGRRYERRRAGSHFEVIGLEAHRAIADHPDALHAIERRRHGPRLTPRQQKIEQLAADRGFTFDARRDWDPDHLDEFQFFRVHPIEYRDTVVTGRLAAGDAEAELILADVTLDEGVLIPEVYHTTALHLRLPFEIPELILEQEDLLDRALELAGLEDIDFHHYATFSKKFVLRGPDEQAIRELMTPARLEFFEREHAYHLESIGREIVVFDSFMRRASTSEVSAMLAYAERLLEALAPPSR
ncbi:MAG: SulP family inorganic anion transporter [Sandaracinaceae bacterium]